MDIFCIIVITALMECSKTDMRLTCIPLWIDSVSDQAYSMYVTDIMPIALLMALLILTRVFTSDRFLTFYSIQSIPTVRHRYIFYTCTVVVDVIKRIFVLRTLLPRIVVKGSELVILLEWPARSNGNSFCRDKQDVVRTIKKKNRHSYSHIVPQCFLSFVSFDWWIPLLSSFRDNGNKKR